VPLPAVPSPPYDEAEAERRLRQNRADSVALLVKGDHRFLAGDHRAASSFYTAVMRLPKDAGVSAGLITRCTAMVEAIGQLFRDHLLNTLDAKGFTPTHRHPRFQASLDMMLGDRQRRPAYEQFPQTPLVYYYPDLPYVQFARREDFAWADALEAQFEVMQAEALALLVDHQDFRPYVKAESQRPQGDVHGMLENPDWSTYFLWEKGGPVDDHAARCPALFDAVLEGVPLCHIGPRAPSVMLSLLRPGAHIPPHTGMLNTRFICHLPLVIPPDCGFRVGNQTVEWEEGRLLIFDDTVQHEAWNRSDTNRLVLIFDIWRPELSPDERAQVTTLFEAVDSYS
jgi:aspartyl/asparaginyl beta-hydroxylase (cupin superfamily)